MAALRASYLRAGESPFCKFRVLFCLEQGRVCICVSSLSRRRVRLVRCERTPSSSLPSRYLPPPFSFSFVSSKNATFLFVEVFPCAVTEFQERMPVFARPPAAHCYIHDSHRRPYRFIPPAHTLHTFFSLTSPSRSWSSVRLRTRHSRKPALLSLAPWQPFSSLAPLSSFIRSRPFAHETSNHLTRFPTLHSTRRLGAFVHRSMEAACAPPTRLRSGKSMLIRADHDATQRTASMAMSSRPRRARRRRNETRSEAN